MTPRTLTTLKDLHEKRLDADPNYFWALKDINLEVKRGEVVGIIGRNGAGKSTLLKILSRITPPTTGKITYHGHVASLLEVGTGFHRELTGRENVFLNGSILGMKRTEITKKFDEIVAFAEVEKFIDTPVKHYSSGMYVRLAFAVAAHLEAEIMVVDEVLAVGDAEFQRRCLGKISEVASGGRTILFVSHNMSSIRSLCSRCVWLNAGQVQADADPAAVISRYLQSGDKSAGGHECSFAEDPAKEFQLLHARLCNAAGVGAQLFECDDPILIELDCRVHQRIPGLYGYLSISRADGTVVLVSDSHDLGTNPLDQLPLGAHRFRIRLPHRTLAPGSYKVYLNFASPAGVRGFNIDTPGALFTFQLTDHRTRRGNSRGGFLSTLVPWETQPPTTAA
ncbi:MAG: Vitamin B12 import ATP-binding protein BtuD [Verrucomicrobiae bacterium]|nr:Vitamin B12 import ATP-binding protein BtuD [Verrucomicrobiae bacterium]